MDDGAARLRVASPSAGSSLQLRQAWLHRSRAQLGAQRPRTACTPPPPEGGLPSATDGSVAARILHSSAFGSPPRLYPHSSIGVTVQRGPPGFSGGGAAGHQQPPPAPVTPPPPPVQPPQPAVVFAASAGPAQPQPRAQGAAPRPCAAPQPQLRRSLLDEMIDADPGSLQGPPQCAPIGDPLAFAGVSLEPPDDAEPVVSRLRQSCLTGDTPGARRRREAALRHPSAPLIASVMPVGSGAEALLQHLQPELLDGVAALRRGAKLIKYPAHHPGESMLLPDPIERWFFIALPRAPPDQPAETSTSPASAAPSVQLMWAAKPDSNAAKGYVLLSDLCAVQPDALAHGFAPHLGRRPAPGPCGHGTIRGPRQGHKRRPMDAGGCFTLWFRQSAHGRGAGPSPRAPGHGAADTEAAWRQGLRPMHLLASSRKVRNLWCATLEGLRRAGRRGRPLRSGECGTVASGPGDMQRGSTRGPQQQVTGSPPPRPSGSPGPRAAPLAPQPVPAAPMAQTAGGSFARAMHLVAGEEQGQALRDLESLRQWMATRGLAARDSQLLGGAAGAPAAGRDAALRGTAWVADASAGAGPRLLTLQRYGAQHTACGGLPTADSDAHGADPAAAAVTSEELSAMLAAGRASAAPIAIICDAVCAEPPLALTYRLHLPSGASGGAELRRVDGAAAPATGAEALLLYLEPLGSRGELQPRLLLHEEQRPQPLQHPAPGGCSLTAALVAEMLRDPWQPCVSLLRRLQAAVGRGVSPVLCTAHAYDPDADSLPYPLAPAR